MRLSGVLATHYHPDHVGGDMMGMSIPGVAELLEIVAVPVHVQAAELLTCTQPPAWRRRTWFIHDGGGVVAVGNVGVELIHTPGHTPGSQCFLVEGRLLAGDTLFLEGCGRTDLPGADAEDMYESLTQRLARVPDRALLFPGNFYSAAPSAPLGETRRSNYVFAPRNAHSGWPCSATERRDRVLSVRRNRAAMPPFGKGPPLSCRGQWSGAVARPDGPPARQGKSRNEGSEMIRRSSSGRAASRRRCSERLLWFWRWRFSPPRAGVPTRSRASPPSAPRRPRRFRPHPRTPAVDAPPGSSSTTVVPLSRTTEPTILVTMPPGEDEFGVAIPHPLLPDVPLPDEMSNPDLTVLPPEALPPPPPPLASPPTVPFGSRRRS